MSRRPPPHVRSRLPPAGIALAYAAFGLFWFLAVDRFLSTAFGPAVAKWADHAEYLTFIALSTLLIFQMARYQSRRFQEAEGELRDREKLLSKILDTAPASIYLHHDREGLILFSNSGMKKLLGYRGRESEEMRSEDLLKLLHPEDVDRVAKHHEELSRVDDEQVLTVDYRFLDQSGTYRRLRSWERVFDRDEAGRPVSHLGIAVDMTRWFEAKRDLDRSHHFLCVLRSINRLIFVEQDCDRLLSEAVGLLNCSPWIRGARISISLKDRAAIVGSGVFAEGGEREKRGRSVMF